jgi:hypothetical protein
LVGIIVSFFSFYTPGKYGEGEREIFFVTKKHKKEQIQFFFLYSIDGNFKKSDFFSGLLFFSKITTFTQSAYYYILGISRFLLGVFFLKKILPILMIN